MHPDISAFPAAEFYAGQLLDGAEVRRGAARAWHDHRVCPYHPYPSSIALLYNNLAARITTWPPTKHALRAAAVTHPYSAPYAQQWPGCARGARATPAPSHRGPGRRRKDGRRARMRPRAREQHALSSVSSWHRRPQSRSLARERCARRAAAREAARVTARAARAQCFGPLAFYDVPGRESALRGSSSLVNKREAEMALALVARLLERYPDLRLKPVIGIVSPYQAQARAQPGPGAGLASPSPTRPRRGPGCSKPYQAQARAWLLPRGARCTAAQAFQAGRAPCKGVRGSTWLTRC
jgi:hypothetical protein